MNKEETINKDQLLPSELTSEDERTVLQKVMDIVGGKEKPKGPPPETHVNKNGAVMHSMWETTRDNKSLMTPKQVKARKKSKAAKKARKHQRRLRGKG